ncbi:MAG: Adenosylcobinamide kinase / Adenosylcobinamide-phosphate guanylyltransferase, partial [uncultured Blastococcus sp.]
ADTDLPRPATADPGARRRPLRQVALRRAAAAHAARGGLRRLRGRGRRRRRVGRPDRPAPRPAPRLLEHPRDDRPDRRPRQLGAAGAGRLPDHLAGPGHGRLRGVERAAGRRCPAVRGGRRGRGGLGPLPPPGHRREQRGGFGHRACDALGPAVPRRARRPQRPDRGGVGSGVARDRGDPAAPAL